MAHHSKLRFEELAALPFILPGAPVFDCAYANEIWDARQRLALNALIAAEPNK